MDPYEFSKQKDKLTIKHWSPLYPLEVKLNEELVKGPFSITEKTQSEATSPHASTTS